MSNDQLQRFEDQPIRTVWDEETEEWYFSVVDVVSVLTDQATTRNASTYWAVLKKRLKEEGADQLLTNCKQLKLKSHKDGKRYLTDVATTEQLLRIIQSIPSPKAEPFKLWLAQVGTERIEETIDPEQAIDRALETYLKKGYSPDWVHQRLLSIRVRKELTDEWQTHGVEQGREYAILTDEMAVQAFERAEKRKPSRQYEHSGTDAQYAGGGDNDGADKNAESAGTGREPGCRQARRPRGRGCSEGHRKGVWPPRYHL